MHHSLATTFCETLDIEPTAPNILRFVRGIRDTEMKIDLLGNTRCCVDGTSRGPCNGEALYQSRSTALPMRHLDYCEHHAARVSWRGVLKAPTKRPQGRPQLAEGEETVSAHVAMPKSLRDRIPDERRGDRSEFIREAITEKADREGR